MERKVLSPKKVDIERVSACNLYSQISLVEGIPSNSASPTDTWILTFTRNSVMRSPDIEVRDAFLKLSITPATWLKVARYIGVNVDTQTAKFAVEALRGLEYEKDIYLRIIKPMMKKSICPHFVRCYSGGDNCSFSQLVKLGTGGLVLESDIMRNLRYAFFGFRDRPSIDNPVDPDPSLEQIEQNELLAVPIANFSRHAKNLLFSYIVTETIRAPSLKKFMDDKVDNGVDLMGDPTFYAVLFQLCYACYCMYRSDMVHNDLHSGNAWIVSSPSTDVEYTVDGKQYKFKGLEHVAKVYDFDRSYVKSIGDNPNLGGLEMFSQSNKVINVKDFVKILCYVYETTQSPIVFELMELWSEKDRTYWNDAFNVGGCYLQYREGRAIPDAKYDELGMSYVDFLNNIYFRYTELGGETNVDEKEVVKFHCNKEDFDIHVALKQKLLMLEEKKE